MRFQTNELVNNGLAKVLALFRQRERGQVVRYSEIERASGISRADRTNWLLLVKKVKREVRNEKGQTLYFVANVGYRIETTSQQLHDRSQRLHRQASRRLVRDRAELEALPDAELSDHERAVKSRKIDRIKYARRQVVGSLLMGHQLAKPSTGDRPRVK